MAISVDSSTEHRLEAAERLVGKPPQSRTRFSWETFLTYLLLSIGAVIMVTPFVWMILTSLKPATELVQFSFLPVNPTLDNYVEVLGTNSFGQWYFNSILIA
ncbi:MAG: carbohydrate ABC transporter permease, partial [Caldilinea sp.]|nr:carbohydrate ABC transporter permease [Caldilinea sp.]